ncbi:sensor histidine kinase [Brachybacterium sacelli]|uniref:histidine kinase n=1 Tax=Brachybacterium sacelli TaxID=173364 RepID=A0ABS4WZI3_9MICO|nr:histidine kinase [Brachybacterium sacelli]MBP2381620.1 signal transduction histidine kinase [Brachybacterium sacelli]
MSPDPVERPERAAIDRRDVMTAVGYAAVVVLLAVSGARNSGFVGGSLQWSPWVSVVMMLVACTSLLWRRRLPVLALVVAGPLAVAEIIVGGQISAYFLLFEALFTPVMHGSLRLARVTTGLAICVAIAAILVAVALGVSWPILLVVLLVSTLVVSTPLLWGWEVRHHRSARLVAESLADVEHELAVTRAAHAVETERRTIAHDLHDVIAGHLSAVSLHTNLASSLEDREARDRSLTTARESAHAALRDLRSMIGVLSTEESGTLPSVTLDWPSLSTRLRGRDAEARIRIDPAATDPARLEPSVQAALLRIAAEASTNAVRHGQAPISLSVQVSGDAVILDLRNRRTGAAVPGTGVGRGAISHRATAVGGSATSGPAPEDSAEAGTWRVLARLPVRADSTAPPTDPPDGTDSSVPSTIQEARP